MILAIRQAPLLVTSLLFLVLFGLRSIVVAPVDIVPADAPIDAFSAVRAHAALTDILGDGAPPHPSGSPENALVRERIEGKLDALGLTSEIQRTFKCSPLAPGCSFVENIISVIPGSAVDARAQPALLVTSHYDSVPGAPGAGDAGSGIAAMLEIAGNLKAAPVANDVILLFADAEETGLRGAMAFVDSHPLMERVGFVINAEARGVDGPSTMFETGDNNLAAVRAFRSTAINPVSASLIVEMYKRMPNGTDFTIYKMKGAQGLNFAFSGGVSLYHSSRDNPAKLSLKSLQHQGDNMLNAVRAVANQPIEVTRADEDAVYFDLFGRALVLWPAHIGSLLAGIALVALGASLVIRRGISFRQGAWAFLFFLLVPVAFGISGYLLSFPLSQFGDIHPLDHPHAWPGRIALVAAALLVSLAIGHAAARRAGASALFHVVWIIAALGGLTLALVLPGVSYLLIAPSLVAGIAALVTVRRSVALAAGLAVLTGGYMAFYHFLMFEAVFNFQLSHFKMLPLLLLGWPFMAAAAGWFTQDGVTVPPLGRALAVVLFAATITALVVPAYTPARPRSVNVNYLADLSTGTFNLEIQTLGPADLDFVRAAGFETAQQPITRYGVQQGKTHLRPTIDLGLTGPEIVITYDVSGPDGRLIEGTIRSPEGRIYTGFGIADGANVTSMKIEDQLVLGLPDRPLAGPIVLRLQGAGTEPKRFALRLKTTASDGLYAFEQGALPPSEDIAAVQALRPDDAAPIHFGDHALIVKPLLP
ncbi:M28 family peptidase [Pseudokordiimonas caeni]|uniref:M28 family peptidase n=1 Tax=Pseudokordiimonas caeni TaxID=2997908 RepID=UPI002810D33E|nr:M28 family peptidase [Pseudokordiimonas caeni]